VLNGVMEAAGISTRGRPEAHARQRGIVLRAIDKLDRLGAEGVRALLGAGRKDESGDFTEGATCPRRPPTSSSPSPRPAAATPPAPSPACASSSAAPRPAAPASTSSNRSPALLDAQGYDGARS
jgi:hypothetical protein